MKRHGRPHVLWTPIVIGVGLLLVGSAGALPWAVGGWEFSSKLTPDGAAGPGWGENPSHAFTFFGSKIALDGSTLVVSTTPDRCDAPSWVYVFTRDEGSWEQLTRLTPSDGSDVGVEDASECSGYGASVAVDEDAGVIAVGNPTLDVRGERQAGAVYIFEREAPGEWTETARFIGPVNGEDGEYPEGEDVSIGPYFGNSIAIDGSTIAVGVPAAMGGGGQPSAGAVHVLERNTSGAWARVAELTPATPEWRGVMGHAVGISGGAIAAGAPNANEVHLFHRSSTGWVQEEVLSPVLDSASAQSAAAFGFDVALEGSNLLVGAPSGPRIGNVPVVGWADSDAGSAYVYGEEAEGWQLDDILRSGDSLHFGKRVDLEGSTAVVGVPHWPEWSASIGAAYVFEETGGGWFPSAELVGNESSQWDAFGYAVGISEGTIAIGAPFDDNRRDGTPPPLNDEGDLHPLACDVLGCSGVDEGEDAGSVYLYESLEASGATPAAARGAVS